MICPRCETNRDALHFLVNGVVEAVFRFRILVVIASGIVHRLLGVLGFGARSRACRVGGLKARALKKMIAP
jgi:hypothetical protein